MRSHRKYMGLQLHTEVKISLTTSATEFLQISVTCDPCTTTSADMCRVVHSMCDSLNSVYISTALHERIATWRTWHSTLEYERSYGLLPSVQLQDARVNEAFVHREQLYGFSLQWTLLGSVIPGRRESFATNSTFKHSHPASVHQLCCRAQEAYVSASCWTGKNFCCTVNTCTASLPCGLLCDTLNW